MINPPDKSESQNQANENPVDSKFTRAALARKKVIFEDQIREAMKDGVLDADEKLLLEKLRLEFGLSEDQTEHLFRQVQREIK